MRNFVLFQPVLSIFAKILEKIYMLHRPKPTKFRYIPRFWDPEKEEREKFRKKDGDDAEERLEGMKSRISRGFSKKEPRFFDGSAYKKSVTVANRRIFVILAALIILVFFVYKSFLI